MRYTIEHRGELLQVEVRPLGTGRYQVQLEDGEPRVIEATTHGALTHLIMGRDSYAVLTGREGASVDVSTRGQTTRIQVLDSAAARRRKGSEGSIAADAGTIRSPMPGRVVKVLVNPGDSVEAGQGIVIVEAMKMENELRSTSAGIVETIHVQAEDRVEGNAELVTISPS